MGLRDWLPKPTERPSLAAYAAQVQAEDTRCRRTLHDLGLRRRCIRKRRHRGHHIDIKGRTW